MRGIFSKHFLEDLTIFFMVWMELSQKSGFLIASKMARVRMKMNKRRACNPIVLSLTSSPLSSLRSCVAIINTIIMAVIAMLWPRDMFITSVCSFNFSQENTSFPVLTDDYFCILWSTINTSLKDFTKWRL